MINIVYFLWLSYNYAKWNSVLIILSVGEYFNECYIYLDISKIDHIVVLSQIANKVI